eukprot:GDKJ01004710.1.p1 GENE.GDKJ01004710.1~~GDKJ01004710.1.p1  ORF type:complete len:1332 (-),score=352.22 GDKJ01004710.1:262-4257(-)
MPSVIFQCTCNITKPGDEVLLVGAHRVFGEWDVTKGIKLQTGSQLWPKWRSTVLYLPLDSRALDYKYVIRSSTGELQWEPFSENRTLTLEEDGSYTVYNHWGAIDRQERPPLHNLPPLAPDGRPIGMNNDFFSNPSHVPLAPFDPPHNNAGNRNPTAAPQNFNPLLQQQPLPAAPPANNRAPSTRSSHHAPPIGSPDWLPSPNPVPAPHALAFLSQQQNAANYSANPAVSVAGSNGSHVREGFRQGNASANMNDHSLDVPSPFPAAVPPTPSVVSSHQTMRTGGGMLIDRRRFIRDRQGKLEDFFLILEKIGEGSWGSVYRVRDRSTGLIRAAKKIPKELLDDISRFRSEVEVLKRVDHPNIVRLFESFEDNENVHLIQEDCAGGELFDRLTSASAAGGARAAFSEREAINIMQQVLSALAYCHAHGIVHRDVKAENFLFLSKSPDSPIKLIDFGLAAIVNPLEACPLFTKVGTPYYIAPEILNVPDELPPSPASDKAYSALGYGYGVDIWSAGVLFYILLVGYPPFNGRSDIAILQSIKKGRLLFPMRDWELISLESRNLVELLLTKDPRQRLSASQALTHAVFSNNNPNNNPSNSLSTPLDATAPFLQTTNAESAAPSSSSMPFSASHPPRLHRNSLLSPADPFAAQQRGDLVSMPPPAGDDARPMLFAPVASNVLPAPVSASSQQQDAPSSTSLSDDKVKGTPANSQPPAACHNVDLVGKLRRFRSLSRLKKLFMTVLAQQCGDAELHELRSLFLSIDLESKGWITPQDLERYARNLAAPLSHGDTSATASNNSDGQVSANGRVSSGPLPSVHASSALATNWVSLLSEVDTTGVGILDYTGFLAACLGKKQMVQESICRAAFVALDLDGDGQVTKKELMELLMQSGYDAVNAEDSDVIEEGEESDSDDEDDDESGCVFDGGTASQAKVRKDNRYSTSAHDLVINAHDELNSNCFFESSAASSTNELLKKQFEAGRSSTGESDRNGTDWNPTSNRRKSRRSSVNPDTALQKLLLKELDEDIGSNTNAIDFDSFFNLIKRVPSSLFAPSQSLGASHQQSHLNTSVANGVGRVEGLGGARGFNSSTVSHPELRSYLLSHMQSSNNMAGKPNEQAHQENHTGLQNSLPYVLPGHTNVVAKLGARSPSSHALVGSRANLSSLYFQALAAPGNVAHAAIGGANAFLGPSESTPLSSDSFRSASMARIAEAFAAQQRERTATHEEERHESGGGFDDARMGQVCGRWGIPVTPQSLNKDNHHNNQHHDVNDFYLHHHQQQPMQQQVCNLIPPVDDKSGNVPTLFIAQRRAAEMAAGKLLKPTAHTPSRTGDTHEGV